MKKKDIIPKAKLPKTDTEYFNLSPIIHHISTTGGIVDASSPTELVTMPSKNAVVTVDLKQDSEVALSNKNISYFDRAVMDSVYTLYANDCICFTPEMIVRVMSGNPSLNVRPQKVGAVTKSLNKLATIRITIDCTEEFKARGLSLRKGETGLLTSYLMPLKEIKLKSVNGEIMMNGFHLIEQPVLYSYAERTGKIATVPTKLLNAPDISDTDDNIIVKRYCIQKIEELKRAKNKHGLNEILYYDTEIEQGALNDLWYNNNFSNIRDKKAKLHKTILIILDTFKIEKYITDYEIITEGSSIIGVRIIP